MKKQLLTATLVAISTLAHANLETPNYDFMAIDFQQFCQQHNTENCKEMAALYIAAKETILTAEEKKQSEERIELLRAAIAQEISAAAEIGIKNEETKTLNLEEDKTEEAQQKSEELAEQLNTQN